MKKKEKREWSPLLDLQKVREKHEVVGHSFWTLYAIECFCGSNGYCWPTNATIAKKVNLPKGTVRRHLAHLEDIGFIRTEQNHENGRREIYLLDGLSDAEFTKKAHAEVAKTDHCIDSGGNYTYYSKM